jgi:hypothetical protein
MKTNTTIFQPSQIAAEIVLSFLRFGCEQKGPPARGLLRAHGGLQ